MKIKIHYTFLIFLILSLLTGVFKHVLAVFIIINLHELGHLFFLKIYKRKVNKITLFPFGSIIDYHDKKNVALYQDFLIAIGGVLVNIFLFMVLFLTAKKSLLYQYNLEVMFFNLLPIFPLDGGRVLEVLFSKYFRYKRALYLLFLVSLVEIIGIIVINLLFLKSISVTLILIYLFVENLSAYKNKEKKYINLLLEKYVNPNKNLKDKPFKNVKNIFHNFFKGVNNILRVDKKTIEEKQILKKYFHQKE